MIPGGYIHEYPSCWKLYRKKDMVSLRTKKTARRQRASEKTYRSKDT